MQPFIGIKRPEEAEHGPSAKAQPAASDRSGVPGPRKVLRSTALGMTVIFSLGMPRAITSSRNPSQIVVTASARRRAWLSTSRVAW